MQALINLETLTKQKLKTLKENAKDKNNSKTEDFNNVDKSKENSVSLYKNVYCTESNVSKDEENLSTTKISNTLQMQTSQATGVHFSTTSIM